MKATPREIDRVLRMLESTSEVLSALAQQREPDRLAQSPGSKSWSAQEILAHLRACADLWGHSIYAMLSEAEPALADADERKWAKTAGYLEVPFHKGLERFSHERAVLLRVLRRLEPEGWERGGITLERRHTVFSQARRMAKHEAEHCKQLEALLKE